MNVARLRGGHTYVLMPPGAGPLLPPQLEAQVRKLESQLAQARQLAAQYEERLTARKEEMNAVSGKSGGAAWGAVGYSAERLLPPAGPCARRAHGCLGRCNKAHAPSHGRDCL